MHSVTTGQRLSSRLQYCLARLRGAKGVSPQRYKNIHRGIEETRARRILEVGVYRGQRSAEMIERAKAFHPAGEIEYFGFDLFEDLTDDMLKIELSKKPQPQEMIRQKLTQTGAAIHLFKGYSQDTLPAFVAECKKEGKTIDFAFIDGGHLVETIEQDWKNVSELMGQDSVVMFDDYYSNTEPEMQAFGCQSIVDGLDPSKYLVEILPPEELFMQDSGVILRIRIAKVSLRPRA